MPTRREPKPTWSAVPPAVKQALGELLGAAVVDARVVYGGYSASATFLLALADGRRVFVKGAAPSSSDFVRRALEREALVYVEATFCLPFAPKVFGDVERDGWRFIAIEDLSDAGHAPPWTSTQLDSVLQRLAELHAIDTELPPWVEDAATEMNDKIWSRLVALGASRAGFCSLFLDPAEAAQWLDAALPKLCAAEARFPPSCRREMPLHMDIRSDNILFRHGTGEPVFLDWNWLVKGSPLVDVGFLAVSVTGEGGPSARTIVQRYLEIARYRESGDECAVAAAGVAGFFADRAYLPPLQEAPRLRWVQRLQLFPALEWAAEELGLPMPPMARTTFD